MKLLLYCTKQPPYLYKHAIGKKEFFTSKEYNKLCVYNGKIVGECDFEVEEIKQSIVEIDKYGLGNVYETKNINYNQLLNESCLSEFEILNYLKDNNGYAIHIKNLHIFDEPKKLSDYRCKKSLEKIKIAPQNMMYIHSLINNPDTMTGTDIETNILISIHPEWLCKILNGEKTIEVRKKVLKEML